MKRTLATLIVVHRYLGAAFCLIFLIWFASGLVMIFKRMPEYTAEERLQRLPPLDAAAIRFTPDQAFDAAALQGTPRRVFLTSFRSRPVYRFAFENGSLTVYADTGWIIEEVDPDGATAIAGDAFPEAGGSLRYVGSLTSPDQWTFGNPFRTTGPLHRIALGDPAATELYVAEATGDIMMKTDRSSRLWGYLGPVTHWFYFTPLRSRGPLWNDLIVYGSVVGCIVCLLGLVIGVFRFSPRRLYMRGTSLSPYVGWLRWHHYAGLLFGVFAFTWTFSGLLTMTPWGLFPDGGPSRAQVEAIRGNGIDIRRFTVPPQAALAAIETRFRPKELELLQFMGVPLYVADERPDVSGRPHQDAARFAGGDVTPGRVLVSATGEPAIRPAFDAGELLAAARAAMPGAAPGEVTWLATYDAYYYDRTGGRRLPVLRVKFEDADQTWLYLAAADGAIVLAEVEGSRTERWLYQGLHSLDVPWLYGSPWLWYPVIIGLSLAGVGLSLTSLVVAWRWAGTIYRAATSVMAAGAALRITEDFVRSGVWWHHARPAVMVPGPCVRRLPLCVVGLALLVCADTPVAAQRPAATPDVQPIVRQVSDRIARWYTRAQTVVSRETVLIQPLGPNLTPVDFSRRLVYELRVGWNPGEGATSAGEPVSVLRDTLSVNGRPPRAGDEPGCMDPKPVSPEPLAMLLPERLGESEFSFAGRGRTDGRPVVMLDYRGAVALPPDITWTDDCVTVSLPGRSRGRLWVDADTHDVLRIDDRLVGQFEFDVPPEHVRRGAASSMVIERAESSIRYRAIQFRDPEETLLLPTSIETVTVIRGRGVQRTRVTQRLTDHRRFLTGGRMLD